MKRLKNPVMLLAFFCLCFAKQAYCQTDTLRATTSWDAQWIGLNALFDKGDYYGVYCFHKTVNLTSKPSTFYIHVSADNHYKLYINGTLVSVGPVRSNQYNWYYETINIARYLVAGNNSVAAQVWEEADYRPDWQLTVREGFILQGNTSTEEVMNTNNTWKCVQDKSIGTVWGYFDAVNGENVNMGLAPTAGWNAAGFNDTTWPVASALFPGVIIGQYNTSPYFLVPTMLPQRRLIQQPITVVRRTSGMTVNSPLALPLTVPANTKAIILLDQTFETNAFPVLKFHGGTGAALSLGYAETLYNEGSNFSQKGNRNTVTGQAFRGLTDTITSNGSTGQIFTPFNFRTYRYIQLIVQTSSASLVIDSLYGTATSYPFNQVATFSSDNTGVAPIRAIGWLTALDNAYETYTDCPYYEQSQYIADSRVQAMISYYESGDDRLAVSALNAMDMGRLPDGRGLCKYPSKSTEFIPTFSLLYIGMLYDYYMYRNNSAFVKTKLLGVEAILNYFMQYQGTDGSLANPPYLNYVDASTGVNSWYLGVPPLGTDGCSAVTDFTLLQAYQEAYTMETAIGSAEHASTYNTKITQLKTTIQSKYWNATKALYGDTKTQTTFSQHANAMAILTGLITDSATMLAFGNRIVADSSTLTQCNIYYKYYLHQAFVKCGLGNNYLNWLSNWRAAIADGLTTLPEINDLVNNRSDCPWVGGPSEYRNFQDDIRD